MSIRRSAVVAAVSGLAVALPAAAQSIPWLNPVNGNWNDPTKWTGGNVPDVSGEVGRLNVAGTYVVTQNLAGLTLSAINISTTTATLNLTGNSVTLTGANGLTNSGSVVSVGGNTLITGAINNNTSGLIGINTNTAITLAGALTNNGQILVNTTGNNSFGTTLAAGTPVVISGSGSILLNGNGGTGHMAGPSTFENGASHLIHGRGQITAGLTNQGVVQADQPSQTLSLVTSPMTNNGTMRASNDAILSISGILVTQGASGVIEADDGSVNLSSAGLSDGTLRTFNDGFLGNVSGTSTLTNVTNEGNLFINTNTTISLAGSMLNNEGTVVVNTTGNNSFTTTLNASTSVLIDGPGDILLNGSFSAGQLTNSVGAVVTNGSSHTIHGRGQITTPLVNNGLVDADFAGLTLALNSNGKTNNAVMRASNTGTMSITGITITQAPGAVVSADGGLVDLFTAGISGGEIEAINGGLIRGILGNQTLTNVNLTGPLNVNTNTSVSLAGGSFTNNGSVLVNDQGNNGFATTLSMSGDIAIDGTGEIVLNGSAAAGQITGNTLTLGSGQTVRGRGQIVAPMTNNGTVHSNVNGQAIALNTNNKLNNATMRASGGGVLAINGITVNQSPSGVIEADGGFVDLNIGGITGGSLAGTNGARFRGIAGLQTLTDIASSAQIDVNTNSAISLVGSIVNDGEFLVNHSANNGFATTLSMNGPVSMSGTGRVYLNASGAAAQLTGSSLSMGPGQTLTGIGNINCPLFMEGTMAPGRPVGALNVPSTGNIVTYQPGSTFEAELSSASSYDRVTGGSHTINGGTVEVTLVDGYAPTLFTKHTIIDGSGASVVIGKFDGITGPALPPPLVWKIGYSAQDVVIGVTCPSDTNADFIVDILDFLDFFDEFAGCENQPAPCGNLFDADYNGDTFVDILDFLDFLDAFGGGC